MPTLKAASVQTFVDGLDRPFGIAFFPLGPNPQWVYVANTNAVVRFPYRNGDTKARGPAETIIAKLTESRSDHWTRDILFSPDGKRMFVSVGSGSNVAEGMPKKTPDEVKAWQAGHALGAAWDKEVGRADVIVADPAGKDGSSLRRRHPQLRRHGAEPRDPRPLVLDQRAATERATTYRRTT